jgi:hypothetical protein
MIVEVYSKHRGKQKNNRLVVKPANNKAASTRESKKPPMKQLRPIIKSVVPLGR